jgi:uncharacterized membrane protein
MASTRNTLLEWAQDGHLVQQQLEQLIKDITAEPSVEHWLQFLKRLFISCAAIALASSLIFFFAYNWQEIGVLGKFALCQGAMVMALLLYLCRPENDSISQGVLLILCVLTGVLLALVGQVYQTGADPWQLFALWALFILPWVFSINVSSLWIFWIMLFNLALDLFSDSFNQGGRPFFTSLFILSCANLVLLVLCEVCALSKFQRLIQLGHCMAVKRLLIFVVILLALESVIEWLFLSIFGYDETGYYAIAYYVVLSVGSLIFYRYQRLDIFALATVLFGLIGLIVAIEIKILTDDFDANSLLLLSFTIVGLSSWATFWLKGLIKPFEQSKSNPMSAEFGGSSHEK